MDEEAGRRIQDDQTSHMQPFWACSGRTDGAFCKRKPSMDWIAEAVSTDRRA
jgi:hypothetical protein